MLVQSLPPLGSTGTNRKAPSPAVAPTSSSVPPDFGSFKRNFPGCTATPFQTQHLLNSHANVHSQSQTHYCPVTACPRAESGKGFKQKNELMRHVLDHRSLGYWCPFRPDRGHKFLRTDYLMRHICCCHMDKDKRDSQRPEGGARGRRRRVGS
ncbi:hypothetical protein AOQ84DRAFT_39099 [Glonium stellatum]|uniref:C2H2-type domain-containing protein n=1 Tax=Glonium stellatum TaxID=574774 RepID=A0A8E2F0X6_9PEZI|nr:hypothetical protein AOQ84DRAFT_39099 [Glonium stellatum]